MIAVASTVPRVNNPSPSSEPSKITGRIIVKFSDNTGLQLKTGNSGVVSFGHAAADEINRRHRITKVRPLINRSLSAVSANRFKNIMLVAVPDDAELDAVLAEYNAVPGVEYAEPEYTAELHTLSNDIYQSHQWGLQNDGQGHYFIIRNPGYENDKMVIVNGLPGADIKSGAVFQNPPDNTVTTVVAIIDTGVDTDHPDLAANMWINPGEIADNGIDDDHNGYVDDIFGWDFSPSSDLYNIDAGDNDPTDYYGHGTHCAGIVAAVGNNGIGIIGTAPDTKIMALKIFPSSLTSIMAMAIIYAADNGADVISMSFGLPYRSYLVEEALAYAHEKGVVLCASTGNSAIEEYNYPAGFETTIAIGASNDSDYVADFSTIGSHVDVCAPGLAILSLRADTTDMYEDEEPWVHIVGDEYYLASGTSMSCPMTAGLIAYLRSVSPGLLPEKVRQIIHETADDYIDPYGLGWNLPGWDMYSGYGRINLKQTLAAAPAVRTIINDPYINEIVNGAVEIRGIADGAGFESYTLEYGEGAEPAEYYPIAGLSTPVTNDILAGWNTSGLSGRYTLRLRSGGNNEYRRTVFVANEAAAEVISPKAGDTVSNIIDIVADAYSPDFGYLVVDYGYGAEPTSWSELAVVTVPASNDIVSDWLVESLPEGEYTLRLSVYSSSKLEIQNEIQVNVRSNFSSENAWKINLDADPSLLANYADIDNDGINEIIVGTSSGIRIFEPDGTPDNEHPAVNIVNNLVAPPAVGRLDDDDIDDFVTVGDNPPMIYGFRSGEGDFEFPLGRTPNFEDYSQSEYDFTTLFLKDIDGDGVDEIHLIIVNNSQTVTYVHDAESGLMLAFDSISVYLPVDLDNDGIDELYTYSEWSGIIHRRDHTGNVLDSIGIEMDGGRFFCRGMTAYDIDGDDRPELIVYGNYRGAGYWLYAYDEYFSLKDGWPHSMGIDEFLVPTVPVFADVNHDGAPEYFCVNFDVSYSYVHAWNLDGSPIIPGNPDGFLTIIPRPGKLNMPVLTDVDGDGRADIVACANDDLFFNYQVQRIFAWDISGDLFDEYPFITAPQISLNLASSFRFTPTVGDIDMDGNVDLIMPTADSSLIFMNYPGVAYNPENSPSPIWRYNRRLNGVDSPSEIPNAVDDDPAPLPEQFSLGQNYPNPFNPDTQIGFSVPVRSRVTVKIFDILGRLVTTLIDETVPAGNHSVIWHGVDSEGDPVPSGIYLYSIKTGEYSRARKMVLVK